MPEQLSKEELQALAVETRQDIVKLLSKRPHTQSELAKRLGKHVTTIAEHMSKLEKSGLIERRPDGHKWVYYKLSRKGEKLFAPRIYNWAVMLSISFVAVIVGGGVVMSSLFIGATAPLESARAPAAADTAGIEAPPLVSVTEALPLVALGLVIVGIVGVALALWLRRRARAAALTVLTR